MSYLSDFSAEDKELLISLPYKVGAWISFSDDVEGERDDELEMKALERSIQEIAKRHDDKPMVQEIMSETLKNRDKWEEWADQSFNVLREAEQAIILVRTHGSTRNAKNLRLALMEIGATVASASSELGAFDEIPEEEGFFSKVISKVVDGFSSLSEGDSGHPTNISPAEDSALSRLSAALRVDED